METTNETPSHYGSASGNDLRECCHAATLHYACKSNDDRYALTVNTDRHVVKLFDNFPPHKTTTFRILNVATMDVCAKYGWILNGATFCTATQGVGTFDWHGIELDCDEADTN
jgi:hypothetical protein